jgi:hypothetical protein
VTGSRTPNPGAGRSVVREGTQAPDRGARPPSPDEAHREDRTSTSGTIHQPPGPPRPR